MTDSLLSRSCIRCHKEIDCASYFILQTGPYCFRCMIYLSGEGTIGDMRRAIYDAMDALKRADTEAAIQALERAEDL
jgi:hypothetical protein